MIVTEAIYVVRESDNCPRTFETHFTREEHLSWGSFSKNWAHARFHISHFTYHSSKNVKSTFTYITFNVSNVSFTFISCILLFIFCTVKCDLWSGKCAGVRKSKNASRIGTLDQNIELGWKSSRILSSEIEAGGVFTIGHNWPHNGMDLASALSGWCDERTDLFQIALMPQASDAKTYSLLEPTFCPVSHPS